MILCTAAVACCALIALISAQLGCLELQSGHVIDEDGSWKTSSEYIWSGYTPKSKEPTDFDMKLRDDFPWNESAQLALRTAFHFQPAHHWMNDPDAPLYYQGWYHLFYQYNPVEAYWGLISWGHTVSRDLIHWLYLEQLAMVPDHWYDYNGVWTGSATMLPGGIPGIIYTGSTSESVQLQNVAFPTDPSDPLLLNWTKIAQNPVISPPPGINYTDFRDPTTAWLGSDGLWTLAVGSQIRPAHAGIALLYRSPDFVNWTLVSDTVLHRVNGTGMWECVDFYPISASGDPTGLDTSAVGEGLKHVLKASMDDTRIDFYTIGTYDPQSFTFTPDNPALDLTFGFRYDYGRYYASKTFYDPAKQRRILFGWINESDTRQDDIIKDWSGVQGIPRQVWFDNNTKENLIQWPIEELTSLHESNITIDNVILESGSIMEVEGAQGAQWDIILSFINPLKALYIDDDSSFPTFESEPSLLECSSSGADRNGTFGPFGVFVLSSEDLQERTGVYFYLTPIQAHDKRASSVSWRALICNDLIRSSLATNLDNGVHGGLVTILEDEDQLSLRIIVDHSIIETFAQGGRTTITSRVYPTIALNNSASLFLFNNGSMEVSLKHFEAWRLSSIDLHDYGG